MLTKIRRAFDAVAEEGAPFGMTVRLQGTRRLLSFIPVRDFEGRTVAWFFFILYFAATQRKIEHMAAYDALTGCFTREVLMQRIGEEFLILLLLSSVGQAAEVAEKLRSGIAANPFQRVGTITVSCGVAQRSAEAESFDSVIHEADEKLYAAKEAGRNRVVS